MSRQRDEPPFVDEHRLTIPASRDQVWVALRRYVDRSLTTGGHPWRARILGTTPPSGFEVAAEVPRQQLRLSGRHRFSRYVLVFTLADGVDGTTMASARSYADFPGFHGRVYRGLVIGSRIHVIAVRGMLQSVRRSTLG